MATNLDTATAHIDARSHHTNELPILERANDVDDVVRNLNQIIDWAMAEQSTIGYFAVLYKRSTMAIREAIDGDLFKNSARMAAFDVVFAQRYFDALNAFFHPDEFPDLNLAWEVAFVGHANPETTMLQQMLAGLNAHICFDLGVAAVTVAPNRLRELKPDFDRITDVVGTQTRGMIVVFERLSPGFRWVRWLLPERWVIGRVLGKFRNAAWLFAIDMALHPERVRREARRPHILDRGNRRLVSAPARALDTISRTRPFPRQGREPRRRRQPACAQPHRRASRGCAAGVSLRSAEQVGEFQQSACDQAGGFRVAPRTHLHRRRGRGPAKLPAHPVQHPERRQHRRFPQFPDLATRRG